MAQNKGGEGKGKGTSKLIEDAETQNAKRRAAKNRRRGGAKGLATNGTTILDGVREDRAAAREARNAAREERNRQNLEAAFDTALDHLLRYGNQMIVDKAKKVERRRWSDATLDSVRHLLRLYFFGPEGDTALSIEDELELREGLMGGDNSGVVREVRKRFAGACYLDRRTKGTPGQQREWFGEAYAGAERYHTERRKKRAAERERLAAEQAAVTTDDVVVPDQVAESELATV